MRAVAVTAALALVAAPRVSAAQSAEGRVEVTGAPERGEVNVVARATPDLRVRVAPGRVEVTTHAPDGSVSRRLVVHHAPPSGPLASPVAPAGTPALRTAGWVLAGAGAAGVVLGIAALAAVPDAHVATNGLCPRDAEPYSCGPLRDLQDSVETLGQAAVGVGAALLVLGAGMVVLGSLPSPQRVAAAPPRWWLGAGPAPLGAGVGARF